MLSSRSNRWILIFLVFLFSAESFGQPLTPDDYKRAVSFTPNNLTKEIFNINVQPIWAQDNSGVAYIRTDREGRNFELYDFGEGKIKPLFDTKRLVQVISDTLHANIKPANFLFFSGKVIDRNNVSFMAGNRMWKANLTNYELTEVKTSSTVIGGANSPDGKWAAFVKDYNLYIRSNETGVSKQLSSNGNRDYQYGIDFDATLIEEGVEYNFPISVNWSPDSKWIQTYITDFRSSGKSYFLNWTADSTKNAQLLYQYRSNPGDTGIIKITPVFYNVEKSEEWINKKATGIIGNESNYVWSREPGIIYQTLFTRGNKSFYFTRIELGLKVEDTLYRESGKTYIENFHYRLLEDQNILVFLSEKSGWRQLYKINLKTGKENPITKGNYFINSIIDIDTNNGDIYFVASGKEETHNPYFEHLYKINGKTDKIILLTPENLNHSVYLSPDRKYFVDNMSSPEQPTITVLKSTHTGESVKELASVNRNRLTELNYPLPQIFTTKATDSVTTLYGVMWKPSSFDPNKKYPVIEHVYTGANIGNYPKHFAAAINRGYQSLAELGFIIIAMDGRGSPLRSKFFHDFSYKNIQNCLEDHVCGIKQLARKNMWMDIERVGIMGGSFGGYDAVRGLLMYPEFYKVGVANSGNYDLMLMRHNFLEKYMGWPVDSSYTNSSVLSLAKNLKGKLLIACGGLDDNVYPIATFRLIEELLKEGKDFDFLFFPSQRHVFPKYEGYFFKKRWNYFVEYLGGQIPYWDYEIK